MASSLRPSLKSGLSTSYAGSQTEHHDHLSSDVQLLPLNRHKSQQDIVYTEESINEKGKRKSVLFTVLLLLTTLLLGIGLSFGHDAFYRYLDTREVNDVIISQTWVNRVGTALAFLVKTSLVACVTTAYVQLFWYKARNRSFALAKIDTLFALPADPWSFHDLALLLRVPDLLLLGLAMWYVAQLRSMICELTEIVKVPPDCSSCRTWYSTRSVTPNSRHGAIENPTAFLQFHGLGCIPEDQRRLRLRRVDDRCFEDRNCSCCDRSSSRHSSRLPEYDL